MAGRSLIETVEERMRRPDRVVPVCGGPGEMRVSLRVDGITSNPRGLIIRFADGRGVEIDGDWAARAAEYLGVDLQE